RNNKKKEGVIMKFTLLFFCLFISLRSSAQLPSSVLVGYLQNWSTMTLSQVNSNYNVIIVAFALPSSFPDAPANGGGGGNTGYNISFALPAGYATAAAFMADIDLMHTQGKTVLLSIGGATGPIFLNSVAEKNTFISSVNAILATYSNKFDGIDLDFETSSMNFGTGGTAWTITSPSTSQNYLISAIQSIMTTYQTNTSKKMILTMAPETAYVQGGLSTWDVANVNGGSMLPIINALSSQIDLVFVQLYNSGSMLGLDGGTYSESTTIGDFVTSMTEAVIKGFTGVSGIGTYAGLPASKVAVGVPATSNSSTASSGYVNLPVLCNAIKYIKGLIAKPGGWSYTMTASYPSLRGVMTWSINEDYTAQVTPLTAWAFANEYNSCILPTAAPVKLISFEGVRVNDNVYLNWATADEVNNQYFGVERSDNGVLFEEIGKVSGLGTSNLGRNYSYTDNYSYDSNVYYRLAQHDINGNITYCNSITISPSSTSSGLLIQNNPFTDALQVIPFGDNSIQTGTIQIMDYAGRNVVTQEVYLNRPSSFGNDLKPGFYLLQFICQGEITNYKIVKQ
ncbi:MAG TPA: glycosyl hydrolase family 18 protein, partial [Cytophagaceae bacterium]|nr:glycosyl hydrolase family 18 protein [Cytophagaceae bacterium]